MKRFLKFVCVNTLKVLIVVALMFAGAKLVNIYLDTPSNFSTNSIEEFAQLSIQNIMDDEDYENIENSEITEIVAPIIGQESNTSSSATTTESVDANTCYYNNLNLIGKKVYQKYGDSLKKMRSGNYQIDFDNEFSDYINTQGSEAFLEDVSNGINAYNDDHCGTFFLDITKFNIGIKTVSIGNKKTNYVVISPTDSGTYYANSFSSQSQVDSCMSKLESIRTQILASAPTDNDYNKIKYVHDWLVDNVSYDENYENVNRSNEYGAIIDKKAICGGYTKAFKFLLDGLGVKTINVFGLGQTDEGIEGHAWNYVFLNGTWYAIDTTWDDPIVKGGWSSGGHKYDYFLKGSSSFNKTHFVEKKYANLTIDIVYPQLSSRDY